MEPRAFDLNNILVSEAAEIVAAREIARLVHGHGDIDASGDQVEQAARRVIRRKLRQAYYVGHGQIVDYSLRLSPQLDIVIADNTTDPVLFQAESTEYFFYESVYALGEVKSTLRAEAQVTRFLDALAQIKTNLRRNPSPNLFAFMLFPATDGFSLLQLGELYGFKALTDLPNVVCVLEEGVLVHAKYARNSLEQIVPVELSVWPTPHTDSDSAWMTFENESIGVNFALFYYLLNAHLRATRLAGPNLTAYFLDALTNVKGHVFVAKEDSSPPG